VPTIEKKKYHNVSCQKDLLDRKGRSSTLLLEDAEGNRYAWRAGSGKGNAEEKRKKDHGEHVGGFG